MQAIYCRAAMGEGGGGSRKEGIEATRLWMSIHSISYPVCTPRTHPIHASRSNQSHSLRGISYFLFLFSFSFFLIISFLVLI